MKPSQSIYYRAQGGQIMLLTVLAIGAVMLGTTVIAGILTIFQIRQATNLSDSARAIFAADTGIEWALYDFACNVDDTDEKSCIPKPAMTNGSSFAVSVDANSVKSVGSAGKSSRALLLAR